MKTAFFTAILLFCMATAVYAGGFLGPGVQEPIYSAADVLKASDDAPCLLQGHIVSRIMGRKNRYVFQDDSGKVVVEIKRKVFGPYTIRPETLVRIEGEVESSDKYPNEVEVDSLTILE